MKITKTQLRGLIKEELEASLNEDDQMAKAQELAKVFAQSPAIMAAVKSAAQDPEVQAAAQAVGGGGAPIDEIDERLDDSGGDMIAMAGMTMKALAPLVITVAEASAVAALGITGGLSAAAIAILVAAVVIMPHPSFTTGKHLPGGY